MAIAPVVISFLAQGIPQVQQAFKSIQDAAIRAEKAQTAEATQAGRKRVSAAHQEAREKIAAYKFADREHSKAIKHGVREAEKAAKDEVRAAKDAAKEVARAERDKTRSLKQAESERTQIIKDRISRTQQAERDLDRWQRRTQQQQARELRDARQVSNEHNRVNRARGRVAEAVLGAGARGVMSGLGRATQMGIGLATTAAQLGGGFSLADSAARAGGLDLSARQLMNSAKDTGGLSLSQITGKARGASVSTGLEAEDLVHATRAYVAKSADFGGGMENMEFFGKVAKSSNTPVEDVARAAGIMRVQNKTLSPTDMKQMVLDMIAQGKEGSVEIEDLAVMAGKATRTSAAYAGTQTDTQRRLLGLTQIAMRTSGKDPAEAATVLSNISSDAMKHSKDVSKVLGKDFLNKRGQITSTPEDFIADVMSATDGNLQKIQKMGFTQRSQKMFQALAPTFNQAGGGAAGRKAILDDMHQVTNATYTQGQVDKDLANILDAPSEQMASAMRELRDAAGEQLLPVFKDMIPVLKDLIPVLVDAAKVGIPAFAELMKSIAEFVSANKGIITSLAANPVGTLVAFEITKSFAAAGLPAIIRGLFSGAAGGVSVSGAAGGLMKAAGASVGATTAAGVGLAAGTGVAAGALVGGLIYNKGTKYADGVMNADDLAARVRAWGQGDHERGLSPEYAKGQLAAANARLSKTGAFDQAGNVIASPFVDSANKNYAQYQNDNALVDHSDLKKAIEEAAAAGIREGVATGMKAWSASNTGTNGAGRWHSMLDR